MLKPPNYQASYISEDRCISTMDHSSQICSFSSIPPSVQSGFYLAGAMFLKSRPGTLDPCWTFLIWMAYLNIILPFPPLASYGKEILSHRPLMFQWAYQYNPGPLAMGLTYNPCWANRNSSLEFFTLAVREKQHHLFNEVRKCELGTTESHGSNPSGESPLKD